MTRPFRSLIAAAASLFAIVLTFVAAVAASSSVVLLVGAAIAMLLSVVGGGLAIRALTRRESTGLSVAGLLGNGFMGLVGALTALASTSAFSRGRQLRRFGKILLPPVVDDPSWASSELSRLAAGTLLSADALDATTRAALAHQWRENGRTEHASVAAFARLTLDLVALGAPPSLVTAAQEDALDEIHHAELCFALARGIDGRDASPGPFPEAAKARTLSSIPALALAQLAVDSLVDGALHEGVSTRVVAKLARRASDPTLRDVLKRIAADEGRHAAHGWDVVLWCLERGGDSVARALRSAVAMLPTELHSDLPKDARDGGWERWGITGAALEHDELLRAREDITRRVDRLLDGRELRSA
jgi:hypothetical protein